MKVEREKSLPMINYDTVPLVIKEARQQHRPLIHGGDGSSRGNAVVQSEVWTLGGAVENSLRAEDIGNGSIGGAYEFIISLTGWRDPAQVILLDLYSFSALCLLLRRRPPEIVFRGPFYFYFGGLVP